MGSSDSKAPPKKVARAEQRANGAVIGVLALGKIVAQNAARLAGFEIAAKAGAGGNAHRTGKADLLLQKNVYDPGGKQAAQRPALHEQADG